MGIKYTYNNEKKITGRRRFKCMDCGQRFSEMDQLKKHVIKYHKDLFDDWKLEQEPSENGTIDKFLFDRRNPGPHLCVICKKKVTVWDGVHNKYARYCDNPACREAARSMFQKNMKRVYGTDNLLTDPEHQQMMLANRKISGTFTWKDGTTISYTGLFELDFLEHCEKVLELTSMDVVSAPAWTFTKYWDNEAKRERIYIPDFFLPAYNLVIEIKDDSKYPIDSKRKCKLKEAAVIKRNNFNYVKIVEKNYIDFDDLMKKLQENVCVETKKSGDHIFIIPELPE